MLQLSVVTIFCFSLYTGLKVNENISHENRNKRQDASFEWSSEKSHRVGSFHRNSDFVTYRANSVAQLRENRTPRFRDDSDQFHDTYTPLTRRPFTELMSKPTFRELRKRWYYRIPGKKTPISRYQQRKFPYANIVKLSSGCTGTLLTPYHVITAAHCVHDGVRFKENIEMLKVQVQLNYGYRVYYVVKINVPVMWIKSEVLPEYAYDYAVLQLNLPVTGREKFMQLALPTIRTKYSDLHFFGFFPNEANRLWESTCTSEKSRFVYGGNAVLTECEAAVGNSGAAVFAEDAVDGDKIIGILSSSLSQPNDNDFEAIMLLTLSKCLDICAMIYPAGEKYDVCKEVKRRELSYFRVGSNRIMPFFG